MQLPFKGRNYQLTGRDRRVYVSRLRVVRTRSSAAGEDPVIRGDAASAVSFFTRRAAAWVMRHAILHEVALQLTMTNQINGGPFRYKGPANSRALQARIYRDLRRTSPALARLVYKQAKELELKVAASVFSIDNGGGLWD